MVLLEQFSEAEKDGLITQLAELLPRLEQDPNPIIHLVEFLVRPSTFTFSRVLAIKPAIDFVAGLSTPTPSINLITLCLLDKARTSKSDCDIVAGQPHIVAALVRLWLSTGDTAVAHKSHWTLVGLLMAGIEDASTRSPIDEKLMWRRLFRDRDVYGSIFALCSLRTLGQDGQLGKAGKTIAQARLLDLLREIDSEPIRCSQFPDIERAYGVTGDGGLLSFATMHMIDFTNDVVMNLTLIHFCHEFVRSPSPMSDSSQAIDFLVKAGLHSRIVSYYLNPGDMSHDDRTFFYEPSASYVSAYVECCASHLLSDSSLLESILERLSTLFGELEADSPPDTGISTHDVSVLLSMPAATLRTKPQLMICAGRFRKGYTVLRRMITRASVEHQVLTAAP